MKSVIQQDLRACYLTKSPNVAIHHIFGAANRKRSEKYGFVVALRPDWHNMSNYGVHFNKELDLRLKQEAQRYFEAHVGNRARFIKEFGKSYILDGG